MTGKPNGADPIDRAVAAAEAGEAQQPMEQINVKISSTGRPFVVAFPPDMTESELLEVVSWMSNNLRLHLAARRTVKSPIVIARGSLA